MTAFFKYATDHFGRSTREPFDFVKALRLLNPIALDLDTHLSNFLKHIKLPEELTDFAVPMITSSLLLDYYPPGIYGKLELLSLRGGTILTASWRSTPEMCFRPYIKTPTIGWVEAGYLYIIAR